MALPPIVRPWKEKFAKVEPHRNDVRARIGDYYYHEHPREYGFALTRAGGSGGYDFLQVFYGRQTHDSRTDQNWCWSLPWAQWRLARHSLYDQNGDHFTDAPGRELSDERRTIIDMCPKVDFRFVDFDGTKLTARTRMEEREWHRGVRWFKWLSWFYRPKIRRNLDIEFSGETGERKDSWKGGTIGAGIEMLPGEKHKAAFRRYCLKHGMNINEEN